MMRYSLQSRDLILVKCYGFLSLAKTMGENIDKDISKNVSGKYSQKRQDHAKKSATDTLKPSSKRNIENTAEATGDLIGNKSRTTAELRKFQKIHNRIIQKQS